MRPRPAQQFKYGLAGWVITKSAFFILVLYNYGEIVAGFDLPPANPILKGRPPGRPSGRPSAKFVFLSFCLLCVHQYLFIWLNKGA